MEGNRDRARSRRRLATIGGYVFVVAVAGAAIASSLTGGGGGTKNGSAPTEPVPTGAPAPPTETLAPGDPRRLSAPRPGQFHGRLLYSDASCGLRLYDLARAREVAIPATASAGCNIWASPNGRYVAFTPGGIRQPELEPLRALDLRTGRTLRVPPLGPTGSGLPALSDAGVTAVCTLRRAISPLTEVRVVSFRAAARTVPGCDPAFVGGRLLVESADGAIVDGATQKVAIPAYGGVGAPLLTVAARDGRSLAVLGNLPDGAISARVYDGSGRLRRVVTAVGGGSIVRGANYSDDGSLFAALTPLGWQVTRSGTSISTLVVGRFSILSASTAPDGQGIAAVIRDAIALLDPRTLGPVAAIPVAASQVIWLP